MNLEDIGYNSIISKFVLDSGLNKSNIGRVIAVFRDMYLVKTDSDELKTTITGNLQNTIEEKSELPIVGDWVYINKYDDNNAFIMQVLPRNNIIERRTIGKATSKQAIAANIDYGFIIEAISENFNINRLERYLAICNSANVGPVVILTKIDLVSEEELVKIVEDIQKRLYSVPIFSISNITKKGITKLLSSMIKSKTYCLLGLSGVGKSTLLNNLADKHVMETRSISQSTNKGVHTTTHREMFFLKNGVIIIDNPGMREVGLTDSTQGMEITFENIYELAGDCRFSDCTHIHEKDCAVLAAVEKGQIDKATYGNYLKMRKEQFHFSATLVEKRRQDKTFGKMIKNVMKNKKLERK